MTRSNQWYIFLTVGFFCFFIMFKCSGNQNDDIQCFVSNDKIEISSIPFDSLSDKSNLLKTFELMLKNADQDDPELIAFVRTLIRPPSKQPINLDEKNRKDFSQVGQSQIMDKTLEFKRNGFFIEAGGYNGEVFSNTLYFELERDWTGILIEPVTDLYNQLIQKNRNVYSINACIAGNKPFIVKLRLAGPLSGREEVMSKKHKQRIEDEIKSTKYLYIPCFPLYTILKAINVSRVDYFSLDIEGAEWDVIRDLPYDKIDFRSFTIEYPANPSTTGLIKTKLAQNSFKLFKDDYSDLYFIKR